jgi:predicted nucleic acid-binding protein
MTSRRPRLAPDTSVIVAAFASWHEKHAEARDALEPGALLIAHCGLETYSVLTRLPAPHRVAADIAAMFLRLRFSGDPLVLPATAHQSLVTRFAEGGILGGAVYDALVAATAAHHDAALLTMDVRAEATYARVGVSFRRLGR